MSSKCKITNYFLTLQAQRCWSDFCFVNIIIRRFIIAMRRANSLFAANSQLLLSTQSVPLLSSPSLLRLYYHKTERVQSVQVARQQCSCFLSHACTCSQTDPILGRSVRQIKWFENAPGNSSFERGRNGYTAEVLNAGLACIQCMNCFVCWKTLLAKIMTWQKVNQARSLLVNIVNFFILSKHSG